MVTVTVTKGENALTDREQSINRKLRWLCFVVIIVFMVFTVLPRSMASLARTDIYLHYWDYAWGLMTVASYPRIYYYAWLLVEEGYYKPVSLFLGLSSTMVLLIQIFTEAWFIDKAKAWEDWLHD